MGKKIPFVLTALPKRSIPLVGVPILKKKQTKNIKPQIPQAGLHLNTKKEKTIRILNQYQCQTAEGNL